MAAAQLDLPDIEKGATYRQAIIWQNSNKAAINLTGASARMQVRESVDSPNILLELTSNNGGLIIEPALGKINFFISDSNTTALQGEGGVYDLEVVMPDNTVTRLIEGSVVFVPEVTR